MRVKTVLCIAIGYALAEYNLFTEGMAYVPQEYRFGVSLFSIMLFFALLIDRYVVTPRINSKVS